jgi:NitT/TauT family transport system substrate-binding protein
MPGAICAILLGVVSPVSVHAEQLVVTLWGSGMIGAPHAVAMEKGFFEEAGIKITGIMGGAGGGNVVRNVLANDLPYGEVALPAAIAALKQGLPIVVVNGGSLASDNVWVTMPNSGINSLKDLVAKKVAYTTPKSISEAFLLMAFKSAGIDIRQVTLVAGGGIGSGLTLLENGAVDSALIVEPVHSMRKGKYKPVFGVRDSLPPVMSVVGITTREFARQHPEKIRAIIQARRKGVEFIYAHPEEAGRIMARAYDMKPEVGVEAVTAVAKTGYWLSGEVDARLMENLAGGLRLTGELVGDVDWKILIDTSMLPDDLKAKSKVTNE